jgi:hypothetical protein
MLDNDWKGSLKIYLKKFDRKQQGRAEATPGISLMLAKGQKFVSGLLNKVSACRPTYSHKWGQK